MLTDPLLKIAAYRPPLRVLFRAARAGHEVSRVKHVRLLYAANAALDYFAAHLFDNLRAITQDSGLDDCKGVRLPLSFTDRDWAGLVNDYVAFMAQHDPDGLSTCLRHEFAADWAAGDDLELQIDPSDQHRAGYYGFLKELPGWKRIERGLAGTGIEAEFMFDHDGHGQPMVLLGFYSDDSSPLKTRVYNATREQGPLAVANTLS